jgi:hypothetical protein
MTAVAETIVYEAAPSKAESNISGLSSEVCPALVGPSGQFDFTCLYEATDETNTVGSLLSTGDSLLSTTSAAPRSTFNWYLEPTFVGRTVGTIVDAWYTTYPCVVMLGMTCAVDAMPGGAPASAAIVPSTQLQRREREATAKLANAVAALVPDLSEADLGDLVGVSRVTWRGWSSGTRVARRTKRQRLLRLQSILELRRRVDPETSLAHWLDTPVGADLDLTPARLLSTGRDRLVSILAARGPVPGGGPVLDRPIELGLLDKDAVEAELAVSRELYASDSDKGEDV